MCKNCSVVMQENRCARCKLIEVNNDNVTKVRLVTCSHAEVKAQSNTCSSF